MDTKYAEVEERARMFRRTRDARGVSYYMTDEECMKEARRVVQELKEKDKHA